MPDFRPQMLETSASLSPAQIPIRWVLPNPLARIGLRQENNLCDYSLFSDYGSLFRAERFYRSATGSQRRQTSRPLNLH